MLNFNDALISKIISLILGATFLLADISYAGAYQQGGLRVPMGQRGTYNRVQKAEEGQSSAIAPASTPDSNAGSSVSVAPEDTTYLDSVIFEIVGKYAVKYADEHGDVWKYTSQGVFVPSHSEDIGIIMLDEKARVGPDVIFGDLGSGLGHVLFRAAARGTKSVRGWEMEEGIFDDSCKIRDELKRYPEFANVDIDIRHQSYLEEGSGIEECDVLYWYYNQSPYDGGLRNDEKLQEELVKRRFKPGARIIVYGDDHWRNTFQLIEERHNTTLVYRIYDLNSFEDATDVNYPVGESYHTSSKQWPSRAARGNI